MLSSWLTLALGMTDDVAGLKCWVRVVWKIIGSIFGYPDKSSSPIPIDFFVKNCFIGASQDKDRFDRVILGRVRLGFVDLFHLKTDLRKFVLESYFCRLRCVKWIGKQRRSYRMCIHAGAVRLIHETEFKES